MSHGKHLQTTQRLQHVVTFRTACARALFRTACASIEASIEA